MDSCNGNANVYSVVFKAAIDMRDSCVKKDGFLQVCMSMC